MDTLPNGIDPIRKVANKVPEAIIIIMKRKEFFNGIVFVFTNLFQSFVFRALCSEFFQELCLQSFVFRASFSELRFRASFAELS